MRLRTFILLCLFWAGTSYAGDKIILKLHQPPPNKMPVSSLWKMDIENTTKGSITIYLTSSARGDKLGDIVRGKSKTLTVKPGKRTYGYNDFKTGEVNWINRSIQEVIIRTGDVPEDNYTICVSAFDEQGQEIGRENCMVHSVSQMENITLISPADGSEIDPESGANFIWTPMVRCPKWCPDIKIVEVLGKQSPIEAIQKNSVWFEKKDITTSNFTYPNSARKFEEGKKYAWQLSSGDVKSEVWNFVFVGDKAQSEPISETDLCNDFKVEFRNASRRDTFCYNLIITNNHTDARKDEIPIGFRISVKEDSIVSIIGGVPLGWRRTPPEFPPGSTSVQWLFTSGLIPNGNTDLGNIVFNRNRPHSIVVYYEWLNGEESIICGDSMSFLPIYYYEMTNKPSDYYVELQDSILNVQYVNNYASGGTVDLKITDVETQQVVVPNNKIDRGRDKESSKIQLRNINGVNRISVDLGNYDIHPGKKYLMTVSNAKNNYYINFKNSGHEK